MNRIPLIDRANTRADRTDRNACEYCLAAHTVLSKKAGASAEEMAAAQSGQASDPTTQAALGFALKVVNERAHISDADVQSLRAAGFNGRDPGPCGAQPVHDPLHRRHLSMRIGTAPDRVRVGLAAH